MKMWREAIRVVSDGMRNWESTLRLCLILVVIAFALTGPVISHLPVVQLIYVAS